MDKRVILILVIVIVIVAGVGGALFFLNRSATPVATPTPVVSATPAVSSQTAPALTASSFTPLVAGEPSTVDIYIDTKSVSVDGFQFIATLAGNSLPTVPDADTATDGIQIQAAAVPELSVSTNSVTAQDGTFVIRFAMIAADGTVGFSTTSPTKIASIPVSTGTAGKVTLTFNQQNSRVRLTTGGDDALMSVTDASLTVTATTASGASGSGIVTASPVMSTPALTTTTAATTTTTSPFCLATCFTDSDCAAGFVCETDRCVNPACPTSQTCGCGATSGATPVLTTQASSTPVSTPFVSVTPTPMITPVPTIIAMASSSAELPASGSFEYTLLTLGAGLLLIGGGVFLTAKQEA